MSKKIHTKFTTLQSNSILEDSGFWDLLDPENDVNIQINDQNFAFGNISRAMLSDFYLNYRRTISKSVATHYTNKSDYYEVLMELMNENECKFYNSSVNMTVTNFEDMNKLTSAIRTSQVLLQVDEDQNTGVERIFEKITNAANHFFDRLKTYKLLPDWSFTLSAYGEKMNWTHVNSSYKNTTLQENESRMVYIKEKLPYII